MFKVNIMKKAILIVVVSMLMLVHASAQLIPNSGFENWVIKIWTVEPMDWKTNNNQLLCPVVQDSSAYQGILAMKVNQNGTAETGFKCNIPVDTVFVYVKQTSFTPDSVSIYVSVMFQGGEVEHGKWIGNKTISQWTPIAIPVGHNSKSRDSVAIKITGGKNGSTSLSVDEFSITYFTDIKESFYNENYSFFPNPFNDNALFRFENTNNEILKIQIYNEIGQCVKTIEGITGSEIKLEKENLGKGFYFFDLSSAKCIKYRGKFVIE